MFGEEVPTVALAQGVPGHLVAVPIDEHGHAQIGSFAIECTGHRWGNSGWVSACVEPEFPGRRLSQGWREFSLQEAHDAGRHDDPGQTQTGRSKQLRELCLCALSASW